MAKCENVELTFRDKCLLSSIDYASNPNYGSQNPFIAGDCPILLTKQLRIVSKYESCELK